MEFTGKKKGVKIKFERFLGHETQHIRSVNRKWSLQEYFESLKLHLDEMYG